MNKYLKAVQHGIAFLVGNRIISFKKSYEKCYLDCMG